MATSLVTGLSVHPWSGAQVGDAGVLVNGHDANRVYDSRTGTVKVLGLAKPAAAPTSAGTAAGTLNGTYRYRVRWKDASTGTLSLPSAELTLSLESLKPTLNQPSSPPSRATHWIVERTTANGQQFYAVNVTAAAPDGTAIATTTYQDDNTTDATIRNGDKYEENQGLLPCLPRKVFANAGSVFALGGRVHRPTCTVANGSAAVSSADGDFTQAMVGQDFTVDGDTDGKTYKISAVADANNLTLAENYAGTGATTGCKITGARDQVWWSEPTRPEYYGRVDVLALPRNNSRVGDDGEPVLDGIGLGPAGVLYAKPSRLFVHSYTLHPSSPERGGDGRIFALASRRGALGRRSLIQVDGMIYGIDAYGVWRLKPGAEPVEIGQALRLDWRALNFDAGDDFFWGYDAAYRWLNLFVVEPGQSYPKKAYVYDLSSGLWIGTQTWHLAVTACVQTQDLNGAQRCQIYHEVPSGGAAYAWFLNIGTTAGVPPSVTPSGTVTGGSATTLQDSTASWPTSGEKLKGIAVKLTRDADGSSETVAVVDNTGTQLTTVAFTGTAPTAGDTYELGPLEASWKTPRYTCGQPTLKKRFNGVWIWLKHDTDAVDLKVRVYLDGSATPFDDRAASVAEDGVTIVEGEAAVTLNPGALDLQSEGITRYWVPIGADAVDCQVEFYSSAGGKAWQIVAAELDYLFDPGVQVEKDPARD